MNTTRGSREGHHAQHRRDVHRTDPHHPLIGLLIGRTARQTPGRTADRATKNIACGIRVGLPEAREHRTTGVVRTATHRCDMGRPAGLCRPRCDDLLERVPQRSSGRAGRCCRHIRAHRRYGRPALRTLHHGPARFGLLGRIWYLAVEPLMRAILGQDVVGFEGLEHERRVIGFAVGTRVVTEVLAAQYALLGDDGQQGRVEMRCERIECVVLGDDLGQWAESEPHDPRFQHRCGQRRRRVERGPVRGVASGTPELAAGLLGRSETGRAQPDDVIPRFAVREMVHLTDEPVEVAQFEQGSERVAQGVAVPTASTMNTSVSPGPMASPEPRPA